MSRMSDRKRRFEDVLEGGVGTPPVAGISFIPEDALMGMHVADSEDPAEMLVATAVDLGVDFAFVTADTRWAKDAATGLSAHGIAVAWVVDGQLWPVLRESGIQEGLKATAWDPGSLDAGLDAEGVRAQDQVLLGAALGVDAIVIADDLAGASGPLVAPDFFNERLVPRYALLVATAASGGSRTILHSDGDMRVFLSGIARAGFIGIHGGGGLGQEGSERLLVEMRDHGLALLGGIDTSLLQADPDAAVRAGTRAGMLASVGGLLICDDGGLSTPEEIAALATAFRSAGVGA